MLTIREPLRLQTACPMLRLSPAFHERIAANYETEAGGVLAEDLLHLLLEPPEILFSESGEYHWNEYRLHSRENVTLSLVNQILNRIFLGMEARLTYQDEAYIARQLRRLGVREVSWFMDRVRETQGASREIHRLTKLYESHGVILKEVAAGLRERRGKEAGNSGDREGEEISSASLCREVYRRLDTRKIYEETALSNRSQVERAGHRVCEAFRFAEYEKASLLLSLAKAEETALGRRGELWSRHNENPYELEPGAKDSAAEPAIPVMSRMISAVLLNLAEEAYTLQLREIVDLKQEWADFRHVFRETGENTVKRSESFYREDRRLTEREMFCQQEARKLQSEEAAFLSRFAEYVEASAGETASLEAFGEMFRHSLDLVPDRREYPGENGLEGRARTVLREMETLLEETEHSLEHRNADRDSSAPEKMIGRAEDGGDRKGKSPGPGPETAPALRPVREADAGTDKNYGFPAPGTTGSPGAETPGSTKEMLRRSETEVLQRQVTMEERPVDSEAVRAETAEEPGSGRKPVEGLMPPRLFHSEEGVEERDSETGLSLTYLKAGHLSEELIWRLEEKKQGEERRGRETDGGLQSERKETGSPEAVLAAGVSPAAAQVRAEKAPKSPPLIRENSERAAGERFESRAWDGQETAERIQAPAELPEDQRKKNIEAKAAEKREKGSFPALEQETGQTGENRPLEPAELVYLERESGREGGGRAPLNQGAPESRERGLDRVQNLTEKTGEQDQKAVRKMNLDQVPPAPGTGLLSEPEAGANRLLSTDLRGREESGELPRFSDQKTLLEQGRESVSQLSLTYLDMETAGQNGLPAAQAEKAYISEQTDRDRIFLFRQMAAAVDQIERVAELQEKLVLFRSSGDRKAEIPAENEAGRPAAERETKTPAAGQIPAESFDRDRKEFLTFPREGRRWSALRILGQAGHMRQAGIQKGFPAAGQFAEAETAFLEIEGREQGGPAGGEAANESSQENFSGAAQAAEIRPVSMEMTGEGSEDHGGFWLKDSKAGENFAEIRKYLDRINEQNVLKHQEMSEKQISYQNREIPRVPDMKRIREESRQALEDPTGIRERLHSLSAVREREMGIGQRMEVILKQADDTTRTICENIFRYYGGEEGREAAAHLKPVAQIQLASDLNQFFEGRDQGSTAGQAGESEPRFKDYGSRSDRPAEQRPEKTPGDLSPAGTPPAAAMIYRDPSSQIPEELLKRLEQKQEIRVKEEVKSYAKETVLLQKTETGQREKAAGRSARELQDMIEKGILRQMGSISEKVYRRLEKKLESEMARRGR